MGDLRHLTTETLEYKRDQCMETIKDYERYLKQTNSFMFTLSYMSNIKMQKKRLHKIEAELAYRLLNDNK